MIESKKRTSLRMKKIRTENTSLEIDVRKLLHSLGYRFRLQNKTLKGKPDIRLPRYNALIFVNGCFWHGHNACKKGLIRPKRNSSFWENKINRNKQRDEKVSRILRKDGWRVMTIWECEIYNKLKLSKRISNFLSKNKA